MRFVGLVWLYGVAMVISFSYAWILFTQGFSKLAEIISPWNIWNVLAVGIALAPGLFLLWLAQKMEVRK